MLSSTDTVTCLIGVTQMCSFLNGKVISLVMYICAATYYQVPMYIPDTSDQVHVYVADTSDQVPVYTADTLDQVPVYTADTLDQVHVYI